MLILFTMVLQYLQSVMIVVIPIVVTIVSVLLGFYYFAKTSRNRRDSDNKSYELVVAEQLRRKNMDEITLAKDVKEENRQLALEVKVDMESHVNNIIAILKADNELQRTLLLSEIKLINHDNLQTKQDLLNYIANQQIVNERMEKSIEVISQFMWGTGAKSIPAFLLGEDETEEHKNRPLKGVFKEPDSTQTQESKDKEKEENLP